MAKHLKSKSNTKKKRYNVLSVESLKDHIKKSPPSGIRHITDIILKNEKIKEKYF